MLRVKHIIEGIVPEEPTLLSSPSETYSLLPLEGQVIIDTTDPEKRMPVRYPGIALAVVNNEKSCVYGLWFEQMGKREELNVYNRIRFIKGNDGPVEYTIYDRNDTIVSHLRAEHTTQDTLGKPDLPIISQLQLPE